LLAYKGQEEDFIKRFNGYQNVDFQIVNSYGELVSGSEVVISAVTYTSEDFCDSNCFDEGCLIVPIHTRGFTNCDLFFDKVYADDTSHVHNFKNFDKFKCFHEVCDVVNGLAPGRENDKERIIAYNIGIAIQDIYFASNIYKKLENSTHLHEVELNQPTEKFWV
jgi:ornithine cyclodeaminase/alanine dehydrogenase